ncbi:MAG TPA: 2-hydroxyglutaryl-CoA dehydratase [Firmicutes bacterium]|nr:2-hydroxyglutaryl-CoA dehydratase [Bacillota bacterium]
MPDVTVGIPRGLFFYTFYPLWKAFFQELGAKVLVSPPTTKKILDAGVEETVTDACIPIKVYHGHAKFLRDKVDYLFIPRMVNYRGKQTFCPKFLGLPDMVRYSIPNLPPVISPRVAIRGSKRRLFQAFHETGIYFTDDQRLIKRAGQRALEAHRAYLELLSQGVSVPEALRTIDGRPTKQRPVPHPNPLRLAVLGYPYVINDGYTSMDLVNHLADCGVQYFTFENLSLEEIHRGKYWDSKDVFWYFSHTILKTASYIFQGHRPVDGIIHVTAFGCGPDFLVNRLLEGEAKKHDLPFLTLTIDEQSGQSGVLTRLEAFCDMVRRRQRQREGTTSA